MGCRLHYAREYRIEWDGGWFNWGAEQFRFILRKFNVEVWECVNNPSDYDDIEISMENWEFLKEQLAKVKTEDYDKPILSEGELSMLDIKGDEAITYKDFITVIDEIDYNFDVDNDFVRLTWF